MPALLLGRGAFAATLAGGVSVDVEEELITFLANVQKGPGKPRLDGTPRKLREEDPTRRERNREIILSHFGFSSGTHFWPTLEQIAERYPEITSRERIRQIIGNGYGNHLPASPLPVASEAAGVLAERDLWLERDYLETLQQRGLCGPLEHAIGLLTYFETQSLALDYGVYLPSLQRATRSTYLHSENRFIMREADAASLREALAEARSIPGQSGLARLSWVGGNGANPVENRLKEIIRHTPSAWTGWHGGEFWYAFEDRENVLVNYAAKTFAVTDRCPLPQLGDILANALVRRTPAFEYPPADLICMWVAQSGHFAVEHDVVTFKGTPATLTEIENAVRKLAEGFGPLTSQHLRRELESQGFGKPLVDGTVFHSPLLHVDKSGGKGNYRFTLATDLGQPADRQDLYHAFRERLSALGATDREAAATVRREQSILAEWIFGEADAGVCALCNRPFARRGLIVAHKKKRSRCADSERLDPYIVFPLCKFGCDYLYEDGFVTVREGEVVAGKPLAGATERQMAQTLIGNAVSARWREGPPSYFDNG